MQKQGGTRGVLTYSHCSDDKDARKVYKRHRNNSGVRGSVLTSSWPGINLVSIYFASLEAPDPTATVQYPKLPICQGKLNFIHLQL